MAAQPGHQAPRLGERPVGRGSVGLRLRRRAGAARRRGPRSAPRGRRPTRPRSGPPRRAASASGSRRQRAIAPPWSSHPSRAERRATSAPETAPPRRSSIRLARRSCSTSSRASTTATSATAASAAARATSSPSTAGEPAAAPLEEPSSRTRPISSSPATIGTSTRTAAPPGSASSGEMTERPRAGSSIATGPPASTEARSATPWSPSPPRMAPSIRACRSRIGLSAPAAGVRPRPQSLTRCAPAALPRRPRPCGSGSPPRPGGRRSCRRRSTGARVLEDRLDHESFSLVVDDDLDLELRPHVDGQARASVVLDHALLAARALHLGDREGRDALLEQLLRIGSNASWRMNASIFFICVSPPMLDSVAVIG